MLRGILLLIFVASLTGCLEDEGTTSAIVIPPGSLLQLNNKVVNEVSEKKYSLYLTKFDIETRKTKNVLDLTTLEKPDSIKQILPKGLDVQGVLVVKVVMEYRNTTWFAFFDPDNVVTPSMETTLTYNLLSNYSKRPLNTYTLTEIKEITDAIVKFKEERVALFGISPDFNPDLLYKFVRNGLSNDVQFLTFLKNYGLDFTFNENGDVTAEPYPFGVLNRSPVIVDRLTTRVADQYVMEMSKLELRVFARDPDNDEVFYAWKFEDQFIKGDKGVFRYEPTYKDSRPAPYAASVLLSDGGKITRVNWPIYVQNLNRPPTYSYDCPTSVMENQEWVCKVILSDVDEDKLSVKVKSISESRPILANGVTAPAKLEEVQELELRWTPNNEDARKKMGTINLEVMDQFGSLVFVAIKIEVIDVNSPPNVLAEVISLNENKSEFDYCKNAMVDNVPPYQFALEFQDPDNVSESPAIPPDIISVSPSGTLASYIRQVGAPQVMSDRVRYVYEWKPRHGALTGSFNVTIRDNHGSKAVTKSFTLTAEDRNTKPCLNAKEHFWLYTSSGQKIGATVASGADYDGDPTYVEVFGMQEGHAAFFGSLGVAALAYFGDGGTNLPFVLKRTIGMSGPAIRKSGNSINIRSYFNTGSIPSGMAGYVKFSRSTPDSSQRVFSTADSFTDASTGITWKPYMNVVINPQDLDVYIPVIAQATTVTAGAVTIINPGIPGLTVTNPTAFSDRGLVTFSRSDTSTQLTIPRFTLVQTAGRRSDYITPDDLVMEVGTSTASIPVWRKPIYISNGTTLSSSNTLSGSPAFTISAVSSFLPSEMDRPVGLTDWNDNYFNYGTNISIYIGFSLYLGTSASQFQIRMLDGASPPVNAINIISGSLPAGATDLKVTNESSFDLEGIVKISRTSADNSITLKANEVIFQTANRTNFTLINDVVLSAGQTQVNAWVKRIDNIGRIVQNANIESRYLTALFEDKNTISSVITPITLIATQGSNLTDGLILVSDTVSKMPSPLYSLSDYWYPQDPFDHFTYRLESKGPAPTGAFSLCRIKGNATDPCPPEQSCENPLAADQTFFKTNKCYFRYNPHPNDYSSTFSFNLIISEKARWGTKENFVNLTLYVRENNLAPALVGGDSLSGPSQDFVNNELKPSDPDEPNDCKDGSYYKMNPLFGDYTEGTETSLAFAVTDENKGADFQTDNFEIYKKIYDLKTKAWVDKPAGLSVAVDKREPISPFGAKSTVKLNWKPSDEDAKKYAGADGLIVRVKIYDALTMPTFRKNVCAYFKVRLNNINNAPSFGEISYNNTLRIYADTYVKFPLFVYDKDAFTPAGGTFKTNLTLCRDSKGNALVNPMLDPPIGNESTEVFDCHAAAPSWPELLTTYDADYNFNINVPECFSGGQIIQDLAVPKFTRIGSPHIDIFGRVRQEYQVEWCPQRQQLGNYPLEIFVTDNGDVDRDGVALGSKRSGAPLNLRVVAPVYFISPRTDVTGNPEHFMKQTSGGMSTNRFTYHTIVNNSQGNKLEYSILSSPRACNLPNGVCIDPDTGVLTWNPNALTDLTPAGGIGHEIKIMVKDSVSQEYDVVRFYLKVQHPLNPIEEQPPVLVGYSPSSLSLTANENSLLAFSLTASDTADDQLFYRWFVNNKIISDEGSVFNFVPKEFDGSLDPDGDSGPQKVGEFKIRGEVTDGNYVVSREWTVKIRNNILLADFLFDVKQARSESSPPIDPRDLKWIGEVPVSITFTDRIVDHLVFAGSYVANSFTKHFLWDLTLINGAISKPNGGNLVNGPWNFIEDLPWLANTQTQRLSVVPDNSNYEILLTSQTKRVASFGLTTEALKVSAGDLTGTALGSSNRCMGDCPQNLFLSPLSSDRRFTAAYDLSYLFYSSDNFDKLMYDYLSPSTYFVAYDFGDSKISGMAFSRSLSRLYVATQRNLSPVSHRLYIFDVKNVKTAVGALPIKIAEFDITDIDENNKNTRPTDIVVDEANKRAFTFLSGTGGVLVLYDGANKTSFDSNTDLKFVGVGKINASPSDVPSEGVRLSMLTSDRILLGTVKETNQLFTIDLDDFSVFTKSAPEYVDSIATFASGQVLLVNRGKGRIYRAR